MCIDVEWVNVTDSNPDNDCHSFFYFSVFIVFDVIDVEAVISKLLWGYLLLFLLLLMFMSCCLRRFVLFILATFLSVFLLLDRLTFEDMSIQPLQLGVRSFYELLDPSRKCLYYCCWVC